MKLIPITLQTLLASLAVLLGLLIMDSISNAVVIASIGSSAFIIFSTPTQNSARFKSVMVGYTLGGLLGLLGNIYPTDVWPLWLLEYHTAILGAAVVGLTMFFMLLSNCKHPPAAAFALGLVLQGWTSGVLIMTLGVLLLIFAVRYVFGRRIIEL